MNSLVKLFGHTLKNPVVAASGCFGFGYEFADVYDINCLGSISLKGTTLEPRYGNPLPRIAECPAGLINAIGLQNPGVEKVISTEIPRLDKVYYDDVIANVGGHGVEEYVAAASAFNGVEKVFAVELNISCPNVKGGGMAFGLDPEVAHDLVKKVKAECVKPLIVKLSPNVTDIVEMAKAVEDAGADGISLVNTFVGMRLDLKSGKPIISVKSGGYSGCGIYPIALRMVYEVSKAVSVPVIGMGGITTAENVIEMMEAGATAVMVGAQNLVDPFACKTIVDDLPKVMAKYKIESLTDVIGLSHKY